MREKISCIYALVFPSGKAYIGSTIDYHKRMREHRSQMMYQNHHCHSLRRAWLKYGETYECVIVEQCERDKLIEREQWWFDNHSYVSLYNASGFAGRVEYTPEVRSRMSAALKGRTYSDEVRARMSEGSKGKVASEATRAKMSAARTGLRHTEETKQKMRDARKGWKWDDGVKSAIGQKSRGRTLNNTSGCVGVSWNTKEKRWKAAIGIGGGIYKHLGSFANFEDAVKARKDAEALYWQPYPSPA